MRRFNGYLLILVLTLIFFGLEGSHYVQASTKQKPPKVFINGHEVNSKPLPIKKGSSIYIPVKYLTKLGFKVSKYRIYSQTETGTIINGNDRIFGLVNGSNYFYKAKVTPLKDSSYPTIEESYGKIKGSTFSKNGNIYVSEDFLKRLPGVKTIWKSQKKRLDLQSKKVKSYVKLDYTVRTNLSFAVSCLKTYVDSRIFKGKTIWYSNKLNNSNFTVITPKNKIIKLKPIEKLNIKSIKLTSFSKKQIKRLFPNEYEPDKVRIEITATRSDKTQIKIISDFIYDFFSVEEGFYYKEPIKNYKVSKKNLDRLKKGEIPLGIKPIEVLLSWGKPYDISRNVGSWGYYEKWVYRFSEYDARFLYFENKVLTSWQD